MLDTSILGRTAKDRITGFVGIATGLSTYISGCTQVLLVPPMGPDGKLPDSHWFDLQRVEVGPNPQVVLDNGATPGCDKPAAVR